MNISILVTAHKPYWMPDDPAYLPVHVGAYDKSSIGFQRDDAGENISARNSNWCELTDLYWAWKNLPCDVLGLAHYRRHFRGKDGALSKEEAVGLLANVDAILPRKRKYDARVFGLVAERLLDPWLAKNVFSSFTIDIIEAVVV